MIIVETPARTLEREVLALTDLVEHPDTPMQDVLFASAVVAALSWLRHGSKAPSEILAEARSQRRKAASTTASTTHKPSPKLH